MMQSEARLIPAQPLHAAAMAELEKLCFSSPWPEDLLARHLADEMNRFFVAVDETGKLLGAIGMVFVLDEGYIHNVAVSPEVRRQGLGKKLVERAKQEGASAKLSFLTLEVRESNAPAIALYQNAGFQTVGRREAYYTQPREAALLMTYFYAEERDEHIC